MQKEEIFLVAQFGKTVGLKGDLKLNLHTDFPQQFQSGRELSTSRGVVKIENYNPKRNLIKIEGFDTPEEARRLTNTKIYSSESETREFCTLKEGEYFWFDLIGLHVTENGEILGQIEDIQRMPQGDYLLIKTDDKLTESGFAKSFLLPYLPVFIQKVEVSEKKVTAAGAKDILEAS